jgi:hypothetical protein
LAALCRIYKVDWAVSARKRHVRASGSVSRRDSRRSVPLPTSRCSGHSRWHGLVQPGTLEDPTSGISAFFNPYEDAVVGQVQQDFDQARRLSDMNQAASAVGSGAYGGSRAAIAEQEARRNLNREELNALGQLRQTGLHASVRRRFSSPRSTAASCSYWR